MNNGDMATTSKGIYKYTPSGLVKCVEPKVVLDVTKNQWYYRNVVNPEP